MRVASPMLLLVAFATSGMAQDWNDPRVLALVRSAAERRAQQLADSDLIDYKATAHGYLTFLAQLGEGFREPPRVVKADELALEVYWRAPNLSKQRIVGRRDTTLLPTDIQYHRDHLGIVQNNFPAIIRLGDGDEVRDVPHPLSAVGLREYDFAIADSLRITIPGQVISVYEVKVRPKDDRQPRVIGSLYVDRDAQVVRMALSFTRAAFLDEQLEDLFIVLENGLVDARFWLPRSQEIEIRRTATWLDYPVRGIIRGRWEISDYALNTGLPRAWFTGPEIVQAPDAGERAYQWPSARILDSLPPDVRAVTADEIRRVQTEARALVRAQALRRSRSSALSAHGISDFVRFNRIEGTAIGFGIREQLGHGVDVSVSGRYGFDDRAPKGRLQLAWQDGPGRTFALYATRQYREASDVPERSLLVNSIAAQEFGSDYTDPFRVDAAGASVRIPWSGWSWIIDGAREVQDSLQLHAVPATGRFRDVLAAVPLREWRGSLSAERPTSLWLAGLEMRARVELRGANTRPAGRCDPGCESAVLGRISADVEIQRPIGAHRVVSRTIAGGVWSTSFVPEQEFLRFGGPVTAPGYPLHALAGEAGVSQRLELQTPIAFPSVSLGRFGRSPASATLAPMLSAAALRGGAVYPSAGIGMLLFFDLVRLDIARGLRGGRWSFYIDVNRAFWSIL